jgi:hypothetical protein
VPPAHRIAQKSRRINHLPRPRAAGRNTGVKAYNAARANRHALPGTFDVEEMGRDLESPDATAERLARVTRLMERCATPRHTPLPLHQQ